MIENHCGMVYLTNDTLSVLQYGITKKCADTIKI